MEAKIAEKLLDILQTRTPRGWVVIDREFQIVYVNDTYCRWRSLTREQIIGSSLLAHCGGRKRQENGQYCCPLIETMDSGKEFKELEAYFLINQPEARLWCLTNTYLLRDSRGQPEYAVGSYVAIDQFKAIENKLDNINMSVIMAFSRAIGARDAYTMRHVENVASMLVGMAEYMGMTAADISLAYLAGVVHDVGKIGIPESILNKPGKLTAEEFAVMQRHPAMGAEILAGIEGFGSICRIVRHHHERYNGSGYPDGLSGTAIPQISRMMALCDSFDAMTGMRCYRTPVSVLEALQEIERCAGSQFDPRLSKVFIDYVSGYATRNQDQGEAAATKVANDWRIV